MLKNAVHVPKLPFHFYKVINLDSIQDTDKSSNTEEAGFVANVVYTMMVRSRINVHSLPVKVGIITPYNNQKVLVTQKIKERWAVITDKTYNICNKTYSSSSFDCGSELTLERVNARMAITAKLIVK